MRVTDREGTQEAVETLERAADALMRLGDTSNAVALYTLALRMRGSVGYWEEDRRDAVT